MPSLIIGSMKQAPADKSKYWRPGDAFSALEYHTMFFTEAEGAVPELDADERAVLRKFGSFIVVVRSMSELYGQVRVTGLDFIDEQTKQRYDRILEFLNLNDPVNKLAMTMPNGSAVQVGDQFDIEYLSILQESGEKYVLLHDYSLDSSRPRFELFADEEYA